MNISDLYSLFKKHPIICTDSRETVKNSLFIALNGENFNGNQFANEAIKKGCAFAIIDDKKYKTCEKTILVNNTLAILQSLATYHRDQLNIPVIGITGTNGKTTSKELIKHVLSTQFSIYATKGNLNNHIGVPLSILRITREHKIAIIEMGANHPKEIEKLCAISKPTHGIITNVGLAHLKGFRNLEGVVKTKNELYEYIKKTKGHLFVNEQNKLLLKLSKGIDQTRYRKKTNIKTKILESTPFIIIEHKNKVIKSNLTGLFQFDNIMLSVSVGRYFKISFNKIISSIADYNPTNNRSQIIKTKYNTLVLDAYNANPSSMEAMLISFSKQKHKNKLCILGDMLELGKHSKIEHKKIITLTEKLNLDTLFIGNEFKKVYKKSFQDLSELQEKISCKMIKNKTILLKGSRGIALERLVGIL